MQSGTMAQWESHWSGIAEDLFAEYSEKADWDGYDKEVKNLRRQMPSAWAKRFDERKATKERELEATLHSDEFIKQYGKDPWSRKGIRNLKELKRTVPFGIANRAAMPGSTVAQVITTKNRPDGPDDARAFFSGKAFNQVGNDLKTNGGLGPIIRHEASHTEFDALGEERLVRAMDGLYHPQNSYQKIHGDADPSEWGMYSRLMQMAQSAGADSNDSMAPVPSYLEGRRRIPADDPVLSNLSNGQRLELLNSASQFDKINHNGLSRSLPGDTAWGDFMRGTERLLGTNSATKAMKRWSELPYAERKQVTKP